MADSEMLIAEMPNGVAIFSVIGELGDHRYEIRRDGLPVARAATFREVNVILDRMDAEDQRRP